MTSDPRQIEQREALLAIRVIDLIVVAFLPVFLYLFARHSTGLGIGLSVTAWGLGAVSLVISLVRPICQWSRYLTLATILVVVVAVFLEPVVRGYGYLVLFAVPPALLFVGGHRVGSIVNGLVWVAATVAIYTNPFGAWKLPEDTSYLFALAASYTMLNLLAYMVMVARTNSYSALAWLSRHDATTGLPTRGVIRSSEVYRTGSVDLISLRDLDGVAAQFGLATAEHVRATFAQRLQARMPKNARLVQYREAAFLVHLPDVDRTQFSELYARMIQDLAAPISNDGSVVVPSMNSAGLTVTDPITAEDALKKLAMTLPVSYSQGPNAHVWFDLGIEREHANRLVMGDRLEQALDGRLLTLVYQPIRYVSGGDSIDLEVLLRWHDPELGHIPPAQFISVAEERGLIERMTRYVISDSWRQLSDFVHGGSVASVSINLSPLHMRSPSFVQQVDATFHYHSIPIERYTLELTETALVDQRIVSSGVLRRLKELGFCLSIDDFGTGYSNLDYLRRLEADRLKIDKSFITGVVPGSRNHSIVQAIVGLSRSLDMITVAEGVESAEDQKLAVSLGCDAIQGYLSGRPMDRDALSTSLRLASTETP